MEHGRPITRAHKRGRDRCSKSPGEVGLGLLRKDEKLNTCNEQQRQYEAKQYEAGIRGQTLCAGPCSRNGSLRDNELYYP